MGGKIPKIKEPKNQNQLRSSVLRFFDLLSCKAFHGIDDGVEHFKLLVETGDLEDFAVGFIAGGDFQVAGERSEGLLSVEQGFDAARFDVHAGIGMEDH